MHQVLDVQIMYLHSKNWDILLIIEVHAQLTVLVKN